MIRADNSINDDNLHTSSNYDFVLRKAGFELFSYAGLYIQVGKINMIQGWIIHISIIPSQFLILFEKIAPLLINSKIPFKIPIDKDIHSNINDGYYGINRIGKIIILFPGNIISIDALISKLKLITDPFKGPVVQTDIRLTKNIYTRYGGYNPIIKGNQKFIYDNKGNLIIDEYCIPYKKPHWIDWPFTTYVGTETTVQSRILKNRYFIVKIIKNDAKGRVMEVIYQRNIFSYKRYLIKEGNFGRVSDNYGRDITDRLNWQFEVHKSLHSTSLIPLVFDIFDEKSNTYLVMELIKGITFNVFLEKLFNGESWLTLIIAKRFLILEKLISILETIEKFHLSGYVHRDINPSNFLIRRNGTVVMIDMELSYNTIKKFPLPAFAIGTRGFISPEQMENNVPNIKQDIYSIGAMLLTSLVRLPPVYFNTREPQKTIEQLSFFIDNEETVSCISLCFNSNPSDRPSLIDIRRVILNYSKNIYVNKHRIFKISEERINSIIKKACIGLSHYPMVTSEGYWNSPVKIENSDIVTIREDREITFGLNEGICGIVFLLIIAKRAGIIIGSLDDIIIKNITLLKSYFFSSIIHFESGFCHSSAGIALTFSQLIKEGFIERAEYQPLIQKCFSRMPSNLNILDGITGYCIALVNCKEFLEKEFYEKKMFEALTILIENQEQDGSWGKNIMKSNDERKILGFLEGIGGISWFLLEYGQSFYNEDAKGAGLNAINWLSKQFKKEKDSARRYISNKHRESLDFLNNGYTIVIPFIKAFELTKNNDFKEIVESVLTSYPSFFIAERFSQLSGLSGLGEIYLEAYRVFQDSIWLERAEWILGVLTNTALEEGDIIYWLQNISSFPFANYMTGNAGIIHFFIRFSHLKKAPDSEILPFWLQSWENY